MASNIQSEITKIKRQIIKILYEDPIIIELLDCPEVDPETPDTAEWTCIFPYIKIPDTQERIGNFIGIKVDSEPVRNSELYKRVYITISIVCAVPSLQVKGYKGIRSDIIGGEICDLLNLNDSLGFKIELVAEGEGVFQDYNYYYRNMRFEALRSNTSKNCPMKD